MARSFGLDPSGFNTITQCMISSLARLSTNSKPATTISTGGVVGSTELNIAVFDEKFTENIGIES